MNVLSKIKFSIIDDTAIRFLIVGLMNNLFGVSIGFIFLTYLLFHFTFSLFLATCISILFNYFTTAAFVFKKNKSLKTLILFIGNYLFIYYLLNILFIYIVTMFFPIEVRFTFILVMPLLWLMTYTSQRKIIFN